MRNGGGPHELASTPKNDRVRAVLELRGVGFSYRHVARVTGVPISTAFDWCAAHPEELGRLREDAHERLDAAAGAAVDVLVAAMHSEDESSRIKAASTVLTNLSRFRRAEGVKVFEKSAVSGVTITGLSDAQADALAAALGDVEEPLALPAP